MEAYKLSSLLEILKGEGLEIAEESSKVLFDSVMKWIEESAKASENTYDDLLIFVLPKIKELVESKLEKINPED